MRFTMMMMMIIIMIMLTFRTENAQIPMDYCKIMEPIMFLGPRLTKGCN